VRKIGRCARAGRPWTLKEACSAGKRCKPLIIQKPDYQNQEALIMSKSKDKIKDNKKKPSKTAKEKKEAKKLKKAGKE
jgi:hypothetical protein